MKLFYTRTGKIFLGIISTISAFAFAVLIFLCAVFGSFGLFSESDYMGKEEDLFFEADTALFYLYRVWIKERGLSRVGLPMLPIPGEDLSESFAEIGEPIQAFEIGEAEIEWILRYAKDPCDENNPYVHSLRGEKIFK